MKTIDIMSEFRKSFYEWKERGYLSLTSRFIWRVVHYVVVFGICFIILQPVLQKLSNAFMSRNDILDISVIYIPKNFSTYFIELTYEKMQYWYALSNTVFLSLLVATLQTIAASLVAYGFARFDFPGRSFLFGLLIFTMIVPPIIILIPQYISLKNFDFFGLISIVKPGGVNILNTFWPFILTSLTVMGYKNGLYVYILRQHYRSLPKELEEAAYIDGCSKFGTYTRIMLPSAAGMMFTCFLYSFVWQWTDGYFISYYTPGFVTLTKKLTTVVVDVTVEIMNELGMYHELLPPFGYSVAIGNTAVLLVILPLLILFFFAQRYFVESIDHSGLK